jgi:hypothetical protein
MRQTGKDSDGISRKLGHMCVSSEIAKYVGAWCVVAGGVVQIASSLAAVPPAIFDFPAFSLVRASHMVCDIRFDLV